MRFRNRREPIRSLLASLSRSLPAFRGKARLGAMLGQFLTNYNSEHDCLVTFRMKDGSLMRVDLRNRSQHRVYWTGEYDSRMVTRLSTYLQPGNTVFDVGANVGFYAIPLGRKLQRMGGKLFAFEPVPSNYNRLLEVVALNELQDTIRPFCTALGDEEGEIELSMEAANHVGTGNAVMLKGNVSKTEAGNCTACITRLDRLAQDEKMEACHLVKIDIEGAEWMFLKGGENFLRKHRPIIYGEFNPYWMQQFGHSILDVASLVSSWDYHLYQQIGYDQFIRMPDPDAGIENVLLAPAEKSEAFLSRDNKIR